MCALLCAQHRRALTATRQYPIQGYQRPQLQAIQIAYRASNEAERRGGGGDPEQKTHSLFYRSSFSLVSRTCSLTKTIIVSIPIHNGNHSTRNYTNCRCFFHLLRMTLGKLRKHRKFFERHCKCTLLLPSGYTKFDLTVDEGKGLQNPSRDMK